MKTRPELIDQAWSISASSPLGQSILGLKMSRRWIPSSIRRLAELTDLDIYYVSRRGRDRPDRRGVRGQRVPVTLAAYVANAACAAFNLPADQKMITLSQLAEQKLITLGRPGASLEQIAA
jgi:hypothetical protein